MAITNFPTVLQGLLQANFLVREMEEGLDSILAYRRLAIPETFPGRIGETMTRTRKGRMTPVTTALNPTLNTGLDNGLAAGGLGTATGKWNIEQYLATLAMYADTQDLNLVMDAAGIADQFIANARNNGVQAAQSLERICRLKLFSAYNGGNTRVINDPTATILTAGNGASSTTRINVDDIRGFQTVLVNGQIAVPTVGNPLPITVIIAGVATLANVTAAPTAFTAFQAGKSVTDITSTPDAVPGFLTVATMSGTPAEGTAVVANNAPAVFRPNARLTMKDLVAADVISLGIIEDGVAYLRDNGVPPLPDGTYACLMDNTSMRQLYADNDFKVLYAGRSQSPEWRDGDVIKQVGVTFVPTTEAYVQLQGSLPTAGAAIAFTGLKIRRPIIVGAEAMIQANFEGMETFLAMRGFDRNDSNVVMVDGVVQIVREPLDRLQQQVSMSWMWVGDYAIPTDNTATTLVIPTASNALYKRAVVIEHIG